MSEQDIYKYLERIDFVGGIVGGDRAADHIKAKLVDADGTAEVNVSDRRSRMLGSAGILDSAGDRMDPATEQTLTAIAAALASNGTDTVQTEQQSPVAVEDSTGTRMDPATEQTLTAIAGALNSNQTDYLHVERSEYASRNEEVQSGQVYTVPTNETWFVNDLHVDGRLYAEGTVVVYGNLTGTGAIKGSGTVRTKN